MTKKRGLAASFLFPAKFSRQVLQQNRHGETYNSAYGRHQGCIGYFMYVHLQKNHQDRSTYRSGFGIAADVVIHLVCFSFTAAAFYKLAAWNFAATSRYLAGIAWPLP
jgi:hypothetical protein